MAVVVVGGGDLKAVNACKQKKKADAHRGHPRSHYPRGHMLILLTFSRRVGRRVARSVTAARQA